MFISSQHADQSLGYIGEFEEVDDHRNGKIIIQLNGRVCSYHDCAKQRTSSDMVNRSTRPVSSLPATTSSSVTSRSGSSSCCPRVNSVSSFSPPRPVSWTTRRPGGSTLLARFSDSSTRFLVLVAVWQGWWYTQRLATCLVT